MTAAEAAQRDRGGPVFYDHGPTCVRLGAGVNLNRSKRSCRFERRGVTRQFKVGGKPKLEGAEF